MVTVHSAHVDLMQAQANLAHAKGDLNAVVAFTEQRVNLLEQQIKAAQVRFQRSVANIREVLQAEKEHAEARVELARLKSAGAKLSRTVETSDATKVLQEHADGMAERLAELQASGLGKNHPSIRAAEKGLESLQRSLSELEPTAKTNPKAPVSALLEIAKKEGELARMKERLGDNHPKIKATKLVLEQLRSRVKDGNSAEFPVVRRPAQRHDLSRETFQALAKLEGMELVNRLVSLGISDRQLSASFLALYPAYSKASDDYASLAVMYLERHPR